MLSVCDAGFFKSTNNQCTPCARGSYKPVVGNQLCTLCPTSSTTFEGAATSVDSCGEWFEMTGGGAATGQSRV